MKLHELTPISFFTISKLHEIKHERGYQVTIFDEISRVESKDVKDEVLFFSHLDGMYGICFKVDDSKRIETDNIINIAGFTDVDEVIMEDFLSFDQIREVIGRSGYGKDGKGEYINARLSDMSDAWVTNSIDFFQTSKFS